MKFWFSHKKDDAAAPKPAATTEAAPKEEEKSVAVQPTKSATGQAQVETIPAPPTLSAATSPNSKTDNFTPLEPATTIVRPKANQKVLYYQLMNGLYDAVLILDDAGNIVDCNERVNQILGYTRVEMWDMQVSTVVKGIGPQIFKQMRDALHNNHQVLINARCTRKDGESFQGEVGVCIMHLTRGENLVFTIRNIEKRLKMFRQQIMKELQPNSVSTKKLAAVRVVAKDDSGKVAIPVASTSSAAPARMVLKKVTRT